MIQESMSGYMRRQPFDGGPAELREDSDAGDSPGVSAGSPTDWGR